MQGQARASSSDTLIVSLTSGPLDMTEFDPRRIPVKPD
jgi:hypothetical protein